MRLELFGAIVFSTLVAAACNSDDEGALGQSVGGTGGDPSGVGGASTGGSVKSTGGTQTGNGGSQTGNGGSQTGSGGSQTGSGGAGDGGNNGSGGSQGGTGGVGTVTCPSTAPNDGEPCSGRGSCQFGSQTCFCSRSQQGGSRSWNCFTVPDGGFAGFPGRGDGGFTPPAQCTQGSDCTGGGDVCCQFNQGSVCLASASCTQFGGTPVP
jgi:hypothetical protein